MAAHARCTASGTSAMPKDIDAELEPAWPPGLGEEEYGGGDKYLQKAAIFDF